jgi:methyl-accepting chemotaxis protein
MDMKKRKDVRRQIMKKKQAGNFVGQKFSSIHSMKASVSILAVVIVLITVAFNLLTIIPSVRNNITELSKNHLYDSAVGYGMLLDEACTLSSPEQILQKDALEQIVGDADIQGMESSYAYVVDFNGTMLYHPTAEKIGSSVENDVIKEVANQAAAGNKAESTVTEYTFKGEKRYAAYYVGTSGDFILVISAKRSEALKFISTMTAKTIFASIISLILCAILSFLVIRKITKPIVSITGVIERLATLDFSVDEEQAKLNMRKDEAGSMSRAITHLREELGNVVYDLKQQSGTLYETATMLSNNTEETLRTVSQVEQATHDIAEGATSQADETEAATNNVVTIGTMVEATNTKVNEIHGIVMEMQKDGDEAAEKIRELDEQNEKTKSSIQTIYEQTNETNQSAKKIREATALIASIAEETSLLSLNASIEAARAGEQGRGFAVVASQIQKLAEQSNESTEKIEEIVTLLIEDSEKAVKTMEEVKSIMKEQVVAVEKTDMIFSRVQKGIQNTKQGIDAIAEHTHQMDEARVNVVDVVQNLTAIAEENAASTQQTSASVTEVSAIVENIAGDANHVKAVAENLEENIGKFRL